MIKKITLDNFKAFKHAEIEIKPLTILVGPNSGGKTSLLNSISLVQQTLRGSGVEILKFGDIGDFDSIIHQDSNPREIGIKFDLDDGTYFNVTISKSNDRLYLKRYSCDNGWIEFQFENLDNKEPDEVNYFRSKYKFRVKKNSNLNKFINEDAEMSFYRDGLLIIPTVSTPTLRDIVLSLENENETANQTSTKVSNQKMSSQKEQILKNKNKLKYENALQFAEIIMSLEKSSNSFNRNVKQTFENIIYIGPLRATATRNYQFGHFDNVGYKGEFAIPIIAENSNIKNKVRDVLIQYNILKDVEILAKSTGKIFEFKLKTDITDSPVNLTDVGFGTSQILPIIVQSVISKDDSMTIVEQPETHLHPKVQADFASFVVESLGRKTKFLIETHSEYFVERIRTCIMSNPNLANDIAIYYIEQNEKEKQSNITLITIDSNGVYSCIYPDGTRGHLPEGYLTNMRVKEIFTQMDIASDKMKKLMEQENDDL